MLNVRGARRALVSKHSAVPTLPFAITLIRELYGKIANQYYKRLEHHLLALIRKSGQLK